MEYLFIENDYGNRNLPRNDYSKMNFTNLYDNAEALDFINNLKQSIYIPTNFELNRDIEYDDRSTLSDKIYNYFPKISMPEILYEVNQWTSFLEDFKGSNKNKQENQKILIASLLADGHNLGFAKMSIASSIDEYTLRRANEFYLNCDNLSSAQKTLVNYHHSLKIVNNCGDGKSSSSDGMRVPINSKTIYADYNAHYGNRGGGIYRHVSDQYTPYYVQILEGRYSNHVLDGLLYHDSSLDIYDHSTDTAGYTEQMFALTYLLGFNFKPRIKNLDQQQLYAFEKFEAKGVKFKKIYEKVILEDEDHVNAQFNWLDFKNGRDRKDFTVAVRKIDEDKYALVSGIARFIIAKVFNENLSAYVTDLTREEFATEFETKKNR